MEPFLCGTLVRFFEHEHEITNATKSKNDTPYTPPNKLDEFREFAYNNRQLLRHAPEANEAYLDDRNFNLAE